MILVFILMFNLSFRFVPFFINNIKLYDSVEMDGQRE